MNKKEFKKIKVGDNVIIKGNGGDGIHHGYKEGQMVTIDEIDRDLTVFAYNHKGVYQWVDYTNIELVEE